MEITSIHQFTPVLARYDAIGETVLEIQKKLREWGYNSEIYVETQIDQTFNITRKYTEYQSNKSDLIIYHHSIGSILADFTSKLDVSKVLCYHNITSSHFFENYNKTIAGQLYNGRIELEKLVNHFEHVMTASSFSKHELQKLGFKKILSLQYFINLERFDHINPKQDIIKKYKNTKNILFVGRKVPNKKIEDLLKIFAYFKIFNPKSRLFVLGGSWSVDTYVQELDNLIHLLHLEDVIFINTLTDKELASYYNIADVFLCMSEHEGFCIPLVEAMYFGVPIVAFNSTAVPDTLGGSGILVNHKKYDEIAEILNIIIENQDLATEIVNKQKMRLQFFNNETAYKILKDNINHIITTN